MRVRATLAVLVTLALLPGTVAAQDSSFGTAVRSGDGDVGETLEDQDAPTEFVYIDADGDGTVDKDQDPIYLSIDRDELTQAINLANSDDEPGTRADTGLQGTDVETLDESLGFVGAGGSFEAGDTIVADHRGDSDEVDVMDVLVSGPEAGTAAGGGSSFLGSSHASYDGQIAYIDDDNSDRFTASSDFAYFDTDNNDRVSANDVRLFARDAPGQATDTDGDGVADGEDNCPNTANPGQDDSDGDGTGDACEDADGDGVADGEDNCPNTANAGQEDSDGDGDGDACDDTPQGGDEQPDADADGVPDGEDNCPNSANANQQDSDGDGDGDACDDTPEGEPAERPDADNDGVPDGEDNCADQANEDQTDTDGDGIGNACDGDADGDGLTNVREKGLGTDPAKADTDGDGVADGEDNCPTTSNADQEDADGDGTGDACTVGGDANGSPAAGPLAVLLAAALALAVLGRRR